MSEQKRYTAQEMRQTAGMDFYATKLGLDDRPGLTDEIRSMLRQAADAEEELATLKGKSCPYALPGGECSAEDRHFQRTVELERENAQLKARLEEVVKIAKNSGWRLRDCDSESHRETHNFAIREILRAARGEGGAE